VAASIVPKIIFFPAQKDGTTAWVLGERSWLVVRIGEVLTPVD